MQLYLQIASCFEIFVLPDYERAIKSNQLGGTKTTQDLLLHYKYALFGRFHLMWWWYWDSFTSVLTNIVLISHKYAARPSFSCDRTWRRCFRGKRISFWGIGLVFYLFFIVIQFLLCFYWIMIVVLLYFHPNIVV